MLVVPERPRPVAGRRAAGASEADAARCAFEHIVGRSAAMAAMIRRARQSRPRRVPVLIEGETGTGKELLARAIHGDAGAASAGRSSPSTAARWSKDLVAASCSAMCAAPSPGATAAGRPGRFELAHGGTLCLDEIGEMPLDLQPVLLRVLEEGVVYRLGDTQPRHVDVRLIAITNRTLRDEVAAGRFRRDLYHRVGVAAITVPPLRERDGDIELLVGHFSEQPGRAASACRGGRFRPRRWWPCTPMAGPAMCANCATWSKACC